MQLRTLKAYFAIENIDLSAAACIDSAVWETFQVGLLNNDTRFGIDTKARQIAWSFTAALDSVADACLNPGHPHIFVSINLEEAKEKIRYTRVIIEATHPNFRPRLIRDSQTELEADDGTRWISEASMIEILTADQAQRLGDAMGASETELTNDGGVRFWFD